MLVDPALVHDAAFKKPKGPKEQSWRTLIVGLSTLERGQYEVELGGGEAREVSPSRFETSRDITKV